jgi:glutaredoxin
MAVGVYKFYPHVFSLHGKGASSSAIAQVFVGPNCGQLCTDVEEIFNSRNVKYELIDVSTPEGEKYGIHQYPLTKVGKQTVPGNSSTLLISALAETYGNAVLTPIERAVMKSHFDEKGKPMVVLYGTSWCQYCAYQRQYFADHHIAYSDVDVESSSAGKTSYSILQGNGYPLVYVGYRRFDGYKEQEILDAIAEL